MALKTKHLHSQTTAEMKKIKLKSYIDINPMMKENLVFSILVFRHKKKMQLGFCGLLLYLPRGGKEKKPVYPPVKKMKAAFPVTSKRSAVHEMPLKVKKCF
jgi:hypothetical protein